MLLQDSANTVPAGTARHRTDDGLQDFFQPIFDGSIVGFHGVDLQRFNYSKGFPGVGHPLKQFVLVTTIANFALPCLSAIRSVVEFNAIWRGGTWIHETRDN